MYCLHAFSVCHSPLKIRAESVLYAAVFLFPLGSDYRHSPQLKCTGGERCSALQLKCTGGEREL